MRAKAAAHEIGEYVYTCITAAFGDDDYRLHWTTDGWSLNPSTLCGRVAQERATILSPVPYCEACYALVDDPFGTEGAA